jgi:hypothetical protein
MCGKKLLRNCSSLENIIFGGVSMENLTKMIWKSMVLDD